MKETKVDRLYRFEDATYTVHVVFRRGSYLRMKRIDESNEFRLGVPYRVSWKQIDAFAIKAIPKLLKAANRREAKPYDGTYLYVLGEKREVGEMDQTSIKRLYKRECYDLILDRLRTYEGLMGIKPPYTLRLRQMKTRLGSNSKKTHTIALSFDLLAYDIDVVDSVLFHELAHHFAFDHSPKFYKVLLKYCPDYDVYRRRILRHDYERKDHLESQSPR